MTMMRGASETKGMRVCIAASVLTMLLLPGIMTGCSGLDPNVHADSLAASAGLIREQIDSGGFVLTAFARVSRADQPLTVYIEGDGYAWLSRSMPSPDPTPHQAMGLSLAAADASPNVVYLARPCQFTPMSLNPRCGIPYWTGKRFAPEVVASLNAAIDRFVARLDARRGQQAQRLNLVGYSGGGALAVLIAARRTDVASIRTVAGNLDDEYVNRLHGVSPMSESENAIDVATRVAGIAQIHFAGADDKVVPPGVAQRFVEREGKQCAQVWTVPGMTHDSDWSALWPSLLAIHPTCAQRSTEAI
jgi:pimeloyl-ACP methyl ester carboxylesterase